MKNSIGKKIADRYCTNKGYVYYSNIEKLANAIDFFIYFEKQQNKEKQIVKDYFDSISKAKDNEFENFIKSFDEFEDFIKSFEKYYDKKN